MTGIALSATTVLAVAAALGVIAHLARRLGGTRRARLGRRGVDWATSFGISAILSAVLGLIMTTINVGIDTAFPQAFLTSLAVGIVVGTPTAYLVVPRVLSLTTPLGTTSAKPDS